MASCTRCVGVRTYVNSKHIVMCSWCVQRMETSNLLVIEHHQAIKCNWNAMYDP